MLKVKIIYGMFGCTAKSQESIVAFPKGRSAYSSVKWYISREKGLYLRCKLGEGCLGIIHFVLEKGFCMKSFRCMLIKLKYFGLMKYIS